MTFPKSDVIWMNGKLVPWDDATIHIGSHVIHYGSAVFEGVRCYNTPEGPAIFRLDAHTERLFNSAKIYRMDMPYTFEELSRAQLETVAANKKEACYIRPIVYRGYEQLGVNPFPCPVDVAIMVWDWGRYLGQEALETGVDVCVSSWARIAPNTLPAMAKTAANYMNSQLIKMEAIKAGYVEGIALDSDGYLSEGSGADIGAKSGRRKYAASSMCRLTYSPCILPFGGTMPGAAWFGLSAGFAATGTGPAGFSVSDGASSIALTTTKSRPVSSSRTKRRRFWYVPSSVIVT